ncbi:hypothetical protein [Cryptosporangium phraense]|uniref:Uncharacterized protein n=1 Tax=Cryptosporangium phraense TaxID=2593070 RepID=A0A545ANK2_9ACTN|nr:hypothetical protein [Cryptosporangium phraense]TQS42841.1 hypothetical protein FL583_22590 [Cryptosporangium phraense]
MNNADDTHQSADDPTDPSLQRTRRSGYVTHVRSDTFHAILAENPGEPDEAAEFPLRLVSPRDRQRVTPSAAFVWETGVETADDGTRSWISRLHFPEPEPLSPEELARSQQEAARIIRSLQEHSRRFSPHDVADEPARTPGRELSPEVTQRDRGSGNSSPQPRPHADVHEIPPEMAETPRRAPLPDPPAPLPHPPPVSEWYRVEWTETSVERQTAYVTAADLALLAREPFSRDIARTVRSADPSSMADLVGNPYDYDLDNSLADLDVAPDAGILDDFNRTDIVISPITEQAMRVAGHDPKPRRCSSCGAPCHWTATGYLHTTDGPWPHGLPHTDVHDAHLAGQPVTDEDVTQTGDNLDNPLADDHTQQPPR